MNLSCNNFNTVKYRLLVENANDILYTLSPEGLFTYVSPKWQELLGYDPSHVRGKSFEVFVHPEDVYICRNYLNRIVSTGEKQNGVCYRVRHLDGRWMWHESNASPLKDAEGKVTEFLGVARDITEKKELEKQLVESNEQLENLLLELPVAVVIVDYNSRKILDLNPKATAILGYTPEELVGRKCNDYICPAQEGNCPIIDMGMEVNHSEREVVNSSGARIPIYKSAITTHHGARKVILECFTDISHMKEMERRLQQMARTDDLTGLFNRRYFMESVKKELVRSERYKIPVSMIMFDIDHFKSINDRYGHTAGDEILRQISRICRENFRQTDIPARLGGEEFGILMPECGIRESGASAKRLREKIADSAFVFEGNRIRCTISIGIAEYVGGTEDMEALIRRADEAMYESKNRGKNQVSFAGDKK
ncbi:MAG: diguanylate cyclase [Desulfobacterales bacterium]